jgi:hypothetical protein
VIVRNNVNPEKIVAYPGQAAVSTASDAVK